MGKTIFRIIELYILVMLIFLKDKKNYDLPESLPPSARRIKLYSGVRRFVSCAGYSVYLSQVCPVRQLFAGIIPPMWAERNLSIRRIDSLVNDFSDTFMCIGKTEMYVNSKYNHFCGYTFLIEYLSIVE